MAVPPSSTLDPIQVEKVKAQIRRDARFKNGVTWFYWIAALSVINSIIYTAGGTITFVVGLGATQVIDGLASGFAERLGSNWAYLKDIGLLLDVIVAAIYALFGFLGKKHHRAPIIIGFILYILDAGITLICKDYFGALFHILALVGIFGAIKVLNEERKSAIMSKITPPSIPMTQS